MTKDELPNGHEDGQFILEAMAMLTLIPRNVIGDANNRTRDATALLVTTRPIAFSSHTIRDSLTLAAASSLKQYYRITTVHASTVPIKKGMFSVDIVVQLVLYVFPRRNNN